jgi:hypothetical protein
MRPPIIKRVVARKYHSCDGCNDNLVTGSEYNQLKFFADQIITIKLCNDCSETYRFWHEKHIPLYADVEDLLACLQADITAERMVMKAEDLADAKNDEKWEAQHENR